LHEVKGKWRRLHNGEHCALYLSPDSFSFDQIKNNKMGRAFCTYGERCIQGFGGEREGDQLEKPGVDGRIILKQILRSGMEA
jgi:hypothetical protein